METDDGGRNFEIANDGKRRNWSAAQSDKTRCTPKSNDFMSPRQSRAVTLASVSRGETKPHIFQPIGRTSSQRTLYYDS